LETYGGFGNLRGFWKPTGVLETYGSFGNLRGFWKPPGVLETYGGFGKLRGAENQMFFKNLPIHPPIHPILKILLYFYAKFPP
jgi:hypothetical protein